MKDFFNDHHALMGFQVVFIIGSILFGLFSGMMFLGSLSTPSNDSLNAMPYFFYIILGIFLTLYFFNKKLILKAEMKMFKSNKRFYRRWEGFYYLQPQNLQ